MSETLVADRTNTQKFSDRAFYVAEANCQFVTKDTTLESWLTNAGFVIGDKRVHGDYALLRNGNLMAYLFLDDIGLDAFIQAFAPNASRTPSELLAWWIP